MNDDEVKKEVARALKFSVSYTLLMILLLGIILVLAEYNLKSRIVELERQVAELQKAKQP